MTISLTALPGESWRLVDALRSLMVPTQPDHGCQSCQLIVASEHSDPSSISYIEDWTTETELRDQVRSDRFVRLLAVMEAGLGPSTVQFDLASGRHGLEYVAETRRDLTRGLPRPSSSRDSA